MTVTKIQPLDKKRYLIYIDYEPGFVLYRAELNKYKISEEKELESNLYSEILSEVLKKRAFIRTLHLLEKRDYTEFQLRNKLKDGYYPAKLIDEAILSAKSYGYIDDERYAERFIEYKSKTKSDRQIRTELKRRGISSEIIDKSMSKAKEADDFRDEIDIIKAILQKRHYYESDRDRKENDKQYRYLLGKGFSLIDIKRALNLDIES